MFGTISGQPVEPHRSRYRKSHLSPHAGVGTLLLGCFGLPAFILEFNHFRAHASLRRTPPQMLGGSRGARKEENDTSKEFFCSYSPQEPKSLHLEEGSCPAVQVQKSLTRVPLEKLDDDKANPLWNVLCNR